MLNDAVKMIHMSYAELSVICTSINTFIHATPPNLLLTAQIRLPSQHFISVNLIIIYYFYNLEPIAKNMTNKPYL